MGSQRSDPDGPSASFCCVCTHSSNFDIAVHLIWNLPASRGTFGHEIMEHSNDLRISAFSQTYYCSYRGTDEHTFHYHLIPCRLLEIIERIWVVAGEGLERRAHRGAHALTRTLVKRCGRRKNGEALKVGNKLGDVRGGAEPVDARGEVLVVPAIGRKHKSDTRGLIGDPPPRP